MLQHVLLPCVVHITSRPASHLAPIAIVALALEELDMWMECDSFYFRRRAIQEREAATRAPHPDARRAHLAMARRFEELSGSIEDWEARLDEGPRARDRAKTH